MCSNIKKPLKIKRKKDVNPTISYLSNETLPHKVNVSSNNPNYPKLNKGKVATTVTKNSPPIFFATVHVVLIMACIRKWADWREHTYIQFPHSQLVHADSNLRPLK